MKTTGRKLLLPLICGLAMHFTMPALAETNFSGKTLELIVPFREDGGSGAWARFMAPFLEKYLPGNPAVNIVYKPGGGSTKAANSFAAKIRADGLSSMVSTTSTHFPFLLGDPRVRYDYRHWRPLTIYPSGGVVYTTPVFGIKNASEISSLKDKRLVFGSLGATSIDLLLLLGFQQLGLDVKPFFGVRGRGAGRLAFERGEATIDFQTSAAYIEYIQPLIATGRATPLFSLGVLNEEGVLVRDPVFPDLPSFSEVYEIIHGKPPAGVAWESWFALFSAGVGTKILVVPKETPDSIVETYQAAIRAMQRDPEYIEARNRVIGSYKHLTGEAADRVYKLATDIPIEQKEWVRDWLHREYKLNIKNK
ncbi:hypothetical protein OAF61_04045 [Pseudomonadales bacterium]|nr:hypothetical protein [Pseudomonadales bacterium]MDB4631634.1 hypothetical protein [Pseudomonadales bacterium]